ncbi:MAG: hypothetical protein H0U49_04040 [Parachlamydiaceae bacterium]|nr:hypothetical protein [Parachlamydiaceae bacterium]
MSLLCLMCPPLLSFAVERAPWLPQDYVIQTNAGYLFEDYQQVASSHSTFHKPATNHFFNFNVGGAYYNYTTDRNWYAEADLLLASNAKQHFGMDSFFLGGRYLLLDDVGLEDPFSLVVGGELTKATKRGLHNLGSFHHGQVEMEIFLSAGKEFDCREFWVFRSWGSLGLGVADVGSPWLVGSMNFERNYRNFHRFMCSLEGLYGWGGNSLHPNMHFKGYGPIKHRSLDLTFSYAYSLECEGTFSIAYTHRVYASNFPSNANMLFLSINYPFSL